jgi:hypothetical protein
MTNDRSETTHPTDLELAQWVDEPELRPAALAAHVERCDACRAGIRELDATRAALAIDPPLPSAAAFAAQRERILAAIAEAPRAVRGGRVVRRLGWLVPLAAAAALAAFFLLGRDEAPRAPGTADAGSTTVAGADPAEADRLPLVADARRAAEEAAAALIPAESTAADRETVVLPAEEIETDVLDAALAAAEPLAPPVSVELTMTTESRFAALAEEDQDAVLLELAGADFEF